MTSESIRRCPYCEGRGCSECSMTGRVVTTYIKRPGGVSARIRGNAPLSPADERAMNDLIDAAYKQMGSTS